MSNFNTSYKTPLDKGYYTEFISTEPTPQQNLEKPIIPIKDLGITVVEKDPRTGANILQNVQAAIRQGASNIQLVMTTPASNPIGGRPKAYGEEVREAIREVAKANELFIGGVEMPTSSHTNMSGFDNRSGFSEKKRHEDMQEVRDAIKFAADVAQGGGVDIWSQEFPRTIFDAKWNTEGKWKDQFYEHPKEHEDAVKHLVDKRNGNIIQNIRVGDKVAYPDWETATRDYVWVDPQTGKQVEVKKDQWVDYDGSPIIDPNLRVPKFDAEKDEFIVNMKDFDFFKKEAEILTEQNKKQARAEGREFTKDEIVRPEEALYKAQVGGKAAEARGQAGQYSREMHSRSQA